MFLPWLTVVFAVTLVSSLMVGHLCVLALHTSTAFGKLVHIIDQKERGDRRLRYFNHKTKRAERRKLRPADT